MSEALRVKPAHARKLWFCETLGVFVVTPSEFGLRSRRVVRPAEIREGTVVWTEAATQRVQLSDLERWICAGPAAFAGLGTHGARQPKVPADLPGWDSEAEFPDGSADAELNNKASPCFDRKLQGRGTGTWLASETIWRDCAAVRNPQGSPILERR